MLTKYLVNLHVIDSTAFSTMKILIACIITFCWLPGMAQHENPDNNRIDFDRFDIKEIALTATKTPLISSHSYADIIIRDCRFDTATLGFMHKHTFDKTRYIRFKNGFSVSIREYFVSSVQNLLSTEPGKPELIIAVKRIWLSDDLLTTHSNEKNLRKDYPKFSGISICLEYLAKQDNQYTPLMRFDTTISGSKSVAANADEYIAEALFESYQQFNSRSVELLLKSSKKYAAEHIDKMYSGRFALPILTTPVQKGIYLTFNEFKNNAPSIKDFTIASDRKTDNLYYIDASGKEVLLRSLYGYSDGNNIYIWTSDNFYRLYKTGNTFNLYAARSFLVRTPKSRVVVPGNILVLGNSFMGPTSTIGLVGRTPDQIGALKMNAPYTRTLNLYQLDMETGDFY